MSSNRSAPAVDIVIRPSRLLTLFLLATHGGALMAIAAAPLSPWIIALLASGVITSFIFYTRRHVLIRGRGAVKRLQWTQEGNWRITEASNRTEEIPAQLLPGAYIGGRWVMLSFKATRFKGDKQRFHVVLVNDNSSPDAVRRLRVRLMHEKPSRK